MNFTNQKTLAKHILRLLKVQELIVPICRINKGNFGIRYSENNDEYEMYLDAVPLSTKDILNDENNIELKRMLDKYLFDASIAYKPDSNPVMPRLRVAPLEVSHAKPKRGRPVGSKNGNNKTKESS